MVGSSSTTRNRSIAHLTGQRRSGTSTNKLGLYYTRHNHKKLQCPFVNKHIFRL
jgi:hypothetical protein